VLPNGKKKTANVKEQYNVVIDSDDLIEAEVDEEKRNVKVTAIKSGWSKNGNYYSKKVAESLSKLLEQRAKIYINHQMRPVGDRRYLGGRDMRDWSAQVLESWGEDGRAKADIHIFEDPDGWLFERIKKFPEEVGLSIDARAYVRQGEAEGKKGTIVDGFVKLNSVDFVPYASAGGRVERLTAMEKEGDDKLIEEFLEALRASDETEKTKPIIAMFEKMEEGDDPGELVRALLLEIQTKTEYEEVEYPSSAYLYAPSEKKPRTWQFRVQTYEGAKLVVDKYLTFQAVRRFSESIMYGSIPGDDVDAIKGRFRETFKKLKTNEKYVPSFIKEGVAESEYSHESAEMLALAEALDLFNSKGTDNDNDITTKDGGDTDVEIDKLTFEELQVGNPTLVEAIKDIVKKESDEKNSVAEKNARIEELEADVAAKQKENDDLTKKVDEYEVAETLRKKEARINELLEESKLPEEVVTDKFRETLKKADDEDEMNELIADRKELVEKKSGKIDDNNSEEPKDDKTTKEPTTKEDVEKSFKR